ncbi:MAG: GNAT family N-acetyltransferase [Planctomycetota bacterium]
MPAPALELTTERLFVQVAPVSAAARVLDYCRRNRAHLAPWEPERQPDYFTKAFWVRQLAGARDEYETGHSVRTVLVRRDCAGFREGREGPVIGVINLSQIVRGAFQAGVLGYSLDRSAEGQGLMSEGLSALVEHAFDTMGLHRIMAAYRPENERSAAVLERLGFEKEGYAKNYLFIDGAWRDHVLTALTRPEPSRTAIPGTPAPISVPLVAGRQGGRRAGKPSNSALK